LATILRVFLWITAWNDVIVNDLAIAIVLLSAKIGGAVVYIS
jgi:hypothetical protein